MSGFGIHCDWTRLCFTADRFKCVLTGNFEYRLLAANLEKLCDRLTCDLTAVYEELGILCYFCTLMETSMTAVWRDFCNGFMS